MALRRKAVGTCYASHLTQGLDTIVGTAGNDVINAYAFNSVTGVDVTTLNSVDTIDGGAGNDTLNIEVKVDAAGTANLNKTIQGTIQNVETINIDNTAALTADLATSVDASKFQGATTVRQIAQAVDVANLAATTTAAFKGVTAAVVADLGVAAAAAASSVSIKLDGLKGAAATAGAEVQNQAYIEVSGAALSSVNVGGTVSKTTTTAGSAAASLLLDVTAGDGVQTISVNTAVKTTVVLHDGATAAKPITAVDASASSGAVTYVGTADVANIKSGAGNDDVTIAANTNVASGTTAAVGAVVATGAGDDTITIDTKNGDLIATTGTTTVDAGAGDDTVVVTTRSDGKLTINLGDGADSLTSSVAILGTDAIDAGAGVDTLLLSLVGSSNVGAFSNFDVFDVAGMTNNLDLDILNAKNIVTEIVGSAAIGAVSAVVAAVPNVTLQNLAAGVNFRATADMAYDANSADTGVQQGTLTLTQKTAGALTVTLDADETGAGDVGTDTAGTSVIATNATSLKAVFDTAYLANIANETANGDNVSTIALAGGAATALEIASGGALSNNVLAYTDSTVGTGAGKLASITITGDRALDLSFAVASATNSLATVDATAQTGGLTFSLANLKNGGTVKLGSGVDVITVTDVSTGPTGHESVSGFEKAAAVAVSTATADATAKAAALADADTLVLTVAKVANANGGVTTGTIDKGVLSFTGAGPATLEDAIFIASSAAEGVGEAVAFEYVGNTFVFVQGATDIVVKLVGVVGVTNFGEVATTGVGDDHFFIV